MRDPDVSVRVFFEKPKSADPESFVIQAIGTIPDATDLDVSVIYRTARFRSREQDSQRIIKSLKSFGLSVVSVHCSPLAK